MLRNISLQIPQHTVVAHSLLDGQGLVDQGRISQAADILANHFHNAITANFFSTNLDNIATNALNVHTADPGVTSIALQQIEGGGGSLDPVRVVLHLSQHLFNDLFESFRLMPQLPPGVQTFEREREGYKKIIFVYNYGHRPVAFDLRMAELRVQGQKPLPAHLPGPMFNY